MRHDLANGSTEHNIPAKQEVGIERFHEANWTSNFSRSAWTVQQFHGAHCGCPERTPLTKTWGRHAPGTGFAEHNASEKTGHWHALGTSFVEDSAPAKTRGRHALRRGFNVREIRQFAILYSLKYIQTSLERKHEDIQAKATENNAEMASKLNEIQATATRLENKYKAIERTVKEVPKIYADIIKASTTYKGKSYGRNACPTKITSRGPPARTLTTKEASYEVKQLINTIASKEITERCQHAVEKASISGIKLQ